MARARFLSADAAAEVVGDGATVALIGGGGGLMEASATFAAIERRFLATARPRNLTVVHALGLGDRKTKGMNCFAHEGMVKRVIGGHWVWSPRMQELARAEKMEAHIMPGGVMTQLFREIGAGRPGLFTHVGLGTVIDPRHGGGKMNASAREDLVELTRIDGGDKPRSRPCRCHARMWRSCAARAPMPTVTSPSTRRRPTLTATRWRWRRTIPAAR